MSHGTFAFPTIKDFFEWRTSMCLLESGLHLFGY